MFKSWEDKDPAAFLVNSVTFVPVNNVFPELKVNLKS